MTKEFLRAPLWSSCVKSVDILQGLWNLISPLPPRTTHHLRGGAYSFIQVTSIFLGWNLSLHNESAKFIGNCYIIFTNSEHNILRDAKRKWNVDYIETFSSLRIQYRTKQSNRATEIFLLVCFSSTVTSIFLGWNLSLHNESAKFIGNFYIIFTNSAHNILRDAKRKWNVDYIETFSSLRIQYWTKQSNRATENFLLVCFSSPAATLFPNQAQEETQNSEKREQRGRLKLTAQPVKYKGGNGWHRNWPPPNCTKWHNTTQYMSNCAVLCQIVSYCVGLCWMTEQSLEITPPLPALPRYRSLLTLHCRIGDMKYS